MRPAILALAFFVVAFPVARPTRITTVPGLRVYHATAPLMLENVGHCYASATPATSWMTPELWCQPRRSVWAPTDWHVWAAEWRPFLVAAVAEVPPGAATAITVPDTLPYGTAWVQFRNAGGASCPSNYVESKP